MIGPETLLEETISIDPVLPGPGYQIERHARAWALERLELETNRETIRGLQAEISRLHGLLAKHGINAT